MRLLLAVLCCLALPVAAQQAAAPDAAALAGRLPAAMVKQMRSSPARFVGETADLILAFGTGGRIGAQGLDDAVASARAGARSAEVARLLAADLDGDFEVSAEEMAVAVAAGPAGSRGALILAVRAADADGDGRVDLAELRAHASAVAMRNVDDAGAARITALIGLDADGDGYLTLAETVAAVEALREGT